MIKSAIKNPYVIIVAALTTIVLGMVSYKKIPADLLPIFKTPAVQIVTFYPGMPPEVMERDIMSRLERWTGQSVGIEHQEGKAMLGVCIVKNFFRDEISLDTAMSQVTSYAVSDMFYLPPGTIPPMIMPFDPTASVPLCLVSVSSPGMNEKELYDIAYFELRNRLQSIQGVIAPAVYGGKLRRILSYIDREKLEARGLSPMDVVDALKRQNVFIPAGNIKAGDIDYQIFVNAMPQRVEELNDIPIAIRSGSPVLLRDVARVRDSSQIQTNIVRINGLRQVYIPIYRQPGANTIQIVDGIQRSLSGILQRLREMDPRAKDLVLEVVLDQSIYVRKSIKSLQIAGILGAILAAFVVFVFLGSLRYTLIIILAIPLSILAAIIGLFFSGNTINAITLGGLALAIGILVDQSIVVLENISRHCRMNKPVPLAAYQGAKEVALPLFVSTFTLIIVFYPVVFLSGMAKYLFTPLAIAVTFAVLASYIISITLIPAYCARYLKLKKKSGSMESHKGKEGDVYLEPGKDEDRNKSEDSCPTDRGKLANLYAALVRKAISRPYLVLMGAAVMLALALFLLSMTGTELFPQVDANQFQIFVRLPSGTRIEKTEITIAEVEKLIIEEMGKPDPEYPKVERHPDSNLKILISNIGVLMDWPAAYTPNTGSMDAFMLVQLKGKKGMPNTFEYVTEIREKLNDRFPGVEFAFDTGGMLTAAINMGEPAPIHIQVSGSMLQTSHSIANIISHEMSKVPGVTDIRIAQRLDYPIINLEIDRIKAAYAGINAEEIMKNLVTATNSSINFDPAFWIDERNGNHYFIGAQYDESELVSFETLRNIPITGSGSRAPVSLRTLAKITRKTGPAVINHRNITRVIDIYASVFPEYKVGTVVSRIEQRLQKSEKLRPISKTADRGAYFEVTGSEFAGKGYSFNISGEVEIMRTSFRQFAFGLVIAVILVYLMMVAQFRSFLDPFIILLTVPLGLIGVGLFLYLTGTALSIQSLMGIIMMTGIVVEYSIVLIDFANRRVKEGADLHRAILDAAQVRLRPILMASLTTFLAILPMAIGFSGAEANVPLARAVIGGVLAATALSLLVVPCIFIVLKRHSNLRKPELDISALA